MENKINPKLKGWLSEVRGRRAALARHLGVVRNLVSLWSNEKNPVPKKYHGKIFDFAGIPAVES